MESKDQGSNLDVDRFMPGLSVDCVILGYQKGQLHVLLLRWKTTHEWALPGGFIDKAEHIDEAAQRILMERTQVSALYLQQFQTFGALDRRDTAKMTEVLNKKLAMDEKVSHWLLQRFVSIAYLSLIEMNTSAPQPDHLSDRCEWVPLSELPDLLFDHRQMVDAALEFLKERISYLPIGRSLLPARFTMKELQYLHEAILQRSLDRANFQKRILKLGLLQKHEKQMTGAAHKAPYLYSFRDNTHS